MGVFIIFIIFVIVIIFIIFNKRDKTFNDPASMDNQNILSAIAGQADWLEKYNSLITKTETIDISGQSFKMAMNRKEYIAKLCIEAISRANKDDSLKYPGATKSISLFYESFEYSKELETKGISKKNAAVRAIKEKIFIPSLGERYPSRWEI